MSRLAHAIHRGPRYIAWRAAESAKSRMRRPWAYAYPRLLTAPALLRALQASDIDALWNDLAAQPFFVSPAMRDEVARRFRHAFPELLEPLRAGAEAVVRHEFDLLGSGACTLGSPLPWHTDFKTGREWPKTYAPTIEYNELDRPSDVKVPWELSRCQHFTKLGQAHWITGDARYADEFVAEVTDWIEANPFAHGVNWACPMDVALRAVSWIWGFFFFSASDACAPPAFRRCFLRSLFLHGAFIVKHLEKADLNGNHYLCDGVGLVFLGLFFQRSHAGREWLRLGRAIVEDEIGRQVTFDGVDFEQSTAYHRLVLEAFLTSYLLLRRYGQEVAPACWSRLERMCEFVAAYTKPDGRAPLIGDADNGRVQILGFEAMNDHRYLLSTAALLFGRGDFTRAAGRCWADTFWLLGADAPDRFERMPAPSDEEPQSVGFPGGGFFVLRSRHAHVIVDCGEVGFGGRGGHGHNDVLSFELFLNGFNVVTDCGAYLYTASREWRNRFRSTAFHNTVQIDEQELNRFLGPDALWQLQYDAVPNGAELCRGRRADVFRGSHRGYERLTPPVSHARRIAVDRDAPAAVVEDSLDGCGEHRLEWRFHFDPAVAAVIEGYDVRLSCGGRVVWLMPIVCGGAPALSLEEGWVSPAYGVKEPAAVAVWRGTASIPITASFLFASERFGDERAAVARALLQAC